MPASPPAKMAVLRLLPVPPALGRGGSLPLEAREGLFRFGRERLLEASGQSLIKCPARFGSLPGLELRHAQIKERIRVERPFPGALLKQLDGTRIFLLFVTQSSEKRGQFGIVG